MDRDKEGLAVTWGPLFAINATDIAVVLFSAKDQ
jgi:hypothetical protein